MPEMTPAELKRRLDAGESTFILDVREPHEYHACNLGGHLVPLRELPYRVHELNAEDEIVVHCHSGARSACAVDFLHKIGFRKVWNLKGGIKAWTAEIGPSLGRH